MASCPMRRMGWRTVVKRRIGVGCDEEVVKADDGDVFRDAQPVHANRPHGSEGGHVVVAADRGGGIAKRQHRPLRA